MNEGNFRKDLQNGLRAMGFFCEKISDRAIGEVKPFDMHACVKGRYWAIECKITKGAGAPVSTNPLIVSHSDMQPHQLPTLLKVAQANGRAWVAAALYNADRTKFAWLVDASVFQKREKWYWQDLNSMAIALLYKPGVGWLLQSGNPSNS